MKLIITALLLAHTPVFADQEAQTVSIEVTETGFKPNKIEVKPGTDLTLDITRKTDKTCSQEIQVPSMGVKKTALPLNKLVTLHLGKMKKGEVRFGCGMEMMDGGKIFVQ